MDFRKLSPGFGLEVLGVDVSSLDGDESAALKKELFKNQVLVARGQTLTPIQFLQFARRIGRPEPHVINQFHHPEHPDILILSNVVKDGKPTGLADAGTYFHTDYSYLEVPALATMLYSIQVPRKGGDTLFVLHRRHSHARCVEGRLHHAAADAGGARAGDHVAVVLALSAQVVSARRAVR